MANSPDYDEELPDLSAGWKGFVPELIALVLVAMADVAWTVVRVARVRASIPKDSSPEFAMIASSFGTSDAIFQGVVLFGLAAIVIAIVGWFRWRKRNKVVF